MSYEPKNDVMTGGLLVPTQGPLGQTIQVFPRLLSDEIAMHVVAAVMANEATVAVDDAVEGAYRIADAMLAFRAGRMHAAKLAAGNGEKA